MKSIVLTSSKYRIRIHLHSIRQFHVATLLEARTFDLKKGNLNGTDCQRECK